jgi:hypothetical protein
MQKLRIGRLRFGTARQTNVLERGTNPKLSRHTCSPRYGLQSCRGESAGVAKPPREQFRCAKIPPELRCTFEVVLTLIENSLNDLPPVQPCPLSPCARGWLALSGARGFRPIPHKAEEIRIKVCKDKKRVFLGGSNVVSNAGAYPAPGSPLRSHSGKRRERRGRRIEPFAVRMGSSRGVVDAAKSSLVDAESSLGDAESSLGDAESSLGDAKSSLGDAKSTQEEEEEEEI